MQNITNAEIPSYSFENIDNGESEFLFHEIKFKNNSDIINILLEKEIEARRRRKRIEFARKLEFERIEFFASYRKARDEENNLEKIIRQKDATISEQKLIIEELLHQNENQETKFKKQKKIK